jgi:hypothetical protein
MDQNIRVSMEVRDATDYNEAHLHNINTVGSVYFNGRLDFLNPESVTDEEIAAELLRAFEAGMESLRAEDLELATV